jgi:hypothetical protein
VLMTESNVLFTGDRYQRLFQGMAVLAKDPAVAEGAFPFNSEGLAFFITAIAEQEILHGLTERDADIVTMLLLLDFHHGPGQVAARIHDMGGECAASMPVHDNLRAIVSSLTAALSLMTSAVP